jgi:hypothetical protein
MTVCLLLMCSCDVANVPEAYAGRIACATGPARGSLALVAAPMPRTPTRPQYRWARAYRHGELVCGRVDLRVSDSARIGLTARERREVFVRFLERIAPELRRELDGLVRRRGDVARRVAERMQAIELVADDLQRGDVRIVGRLQPPQRRHGELYEIEFGVRELPDPGRLPPPAGRSPDARVRRLGRADDG